MTGCAAFILMLAVVGWLSTEKSSAQGGPKVVTPTGKPTKPAGPVINTPTAKPEDPYTQQNYPWHKNITATIFWVGETPTPKNPTPNHASSWDRYWQKSFGGFDDPDPTNRVSYRPISFIPKQNPFYIALPYNDVINHKAHKPEAKKVIPWFRRAMAKPGTTTCKGRWVQIVYGKKVCYAQWEDCGPFTTDDYEYVFLNKRPKNKENKGAGIDVSPAVRDYLGLKSGDKVHWRFIDFRRIRSRGPWSLHGTNNPFLDPKQDPDYDANIRYMNYLRKIRDDANRNGTNY